MSANEDRFAGPYDRVRQAWKAEDTARMSLAYSAEAYLERVDQGNEWLTSMSLEVLRMDRDRLVAARAEWDAAAAALREVAS